MSAVSSPRSDSPAFFILPSFIPPLGSVDQLGGCRLSACCRVWCHIAVEQQGAAGVRHLQRKLLLPLLPAASPSFFSSPSSSSSALSSSYTFLLPSIISPSFALFTSLPVSSLFLSMCHHSSLLPFPLF